MHATSTTDVIAVTAAISDIIRLQIIVPSIEHSETIRTLLLGLGSKAEIFCEKFITRLLWLPITAIPPYIEFFHEIYSFCRLSREAESATFSFTISRHMPFWINGLVLLRRMARDIATFQHPHYRIAVAVVGHAAACIYDAHNDPNSCRDILTQWITADLFGTFEDILPQVLYSIELAGVSSIEFHTYSRCSYVPSSSCACLPWNLSRRRPILLP